MSRQLRRTFSWSDLPPELLSIIADLLKYSNSTLLTFRAVCKNWRSSVPPPFLRLHPFIPCTISFVHRPRLPVDSDGPFLVVTAAVYILRRLGNPNPWLVAVEQSNSDKVRLFHPLTRLPIENLPENFPRMISGFDAIKLSEGLNLRLTDGTALIFERSNNSDSYYVNKVILWPDPRYESQQQLEHQSVMVLYGKGKLTCFRLNGCEKEGTLISVDGFVDDIVTWKGMVWAVGRRGKLSGIDYNSMKVNNVATATSSLEGGRRKRLLVDFNNELYLVVANRYCNQFKVFKLNSLQYAWEKVVSLGDKILFVSVDTCFFARSQDLSGLQGNCIVHPKDCFPSYSGFKKCDGVLFGSASGYLEVGVCKYGEPKNSGLISTFPGFSAAFWPPPLWIWNHHEEQEIRRQVEDEEQVVVDAKNACAGTVVPRSQNNTAKFQGISVRSELVPTLETAWAKYGNIVEGSAICSCDTKAMAYESLAKMLIILQTTTTNYNLTEHQARYLLSTLADLQHMRLNLDWLVPLVSKAVVLHKTKPLVAVMLELVKAEVRADELRKKVFAEMEKVCVGEHASF